MATKVTTRRRTPVDDYILSAPEEIRGRFEFFDGSWHEVPRGHERLALWLRPLRCCAPSAASHR